MLLKREKKKVKIFALLKTNNYFKFKKNVSDSEVWIQVNSMLWLLGKAHVFKNTCMYKRFKIYIFQNRINIFSSNTELVLGHIIIPYPSIYSYSYEVMKKQKYIRMCVTIRFYHYQYVYTVLNSIFGSNLPKILTDQFLYTDFIFSKFLSLCTTQFHV